MLTTPAQKRNNIGKLIRDDKLGAWIVPFSESGSIYPKRITKLAIQKRWFTPEGERAVGTLQLVNQSNNAIVVPRWTRWWDDSGGTYQTTEETVVRPKTVSNLMVEALEVGVKNYFGLVKTNDWLSAENADIDFAEARVLYVQTQLICGEAEDEKDDLSCSTLGASVNIEGGTYRGEYALVIVQKDPLYWNFSEGETLAGFRVMTEHMSGYVYHQVNIKPVLRFWEPQHILLKPETVQIRFVGIKQEKSS